jgi:hypothetical protein
LFDTAERAAADTQREAVRERLMTDLIAKWATNGRTITHSEVVAILQTAGTVAYDPVETTKPASVTLTDIGGDPLLVTDIWDIASVPDPVPDPIP